MTLCEKMLEDDLPEKWRKRLDTFIRETHPDSGHGLSAVDFTENLKLVFPDGSTADFRYAFALTEGSETAVFTEHCGHHIFPSHNLETIAYASA